VQISDHVMLQVELKDQFIGLAELYRRSLLSSQLSIVGRLRCRSALIHQSSIS